MHLKIIFPKNRLSSQGYILDRASLMSVMQQTLFDRNPRLNFEIVFSTENITDGNSSLSQTIWQQDGSLPYLIGEINLPILVFYDPTVVHHNTLFVIIGILESWLTSKEVKNQEIIYISSIIRKV